MPLELVEVGTSAGVGAADILLGYVDEVQGYAKPFQNAQDIGRLVYVGGGYLAETMGWVGDKVSKSAVLAGIPLLEHSAYQAFKSWTAPAGKGKDTDGKTGLRLIEEGKRKRSRDRRGATVRYV